MKVLFRIALFPHFCLLLPSHATLPFSFEALSADAAAARNCAYRHRRCSRLKLPPLLVDGKARSPLRRELAPPAAADSLLQPLRTRASSLGGLPPPAAADSHLQPPRTRTSSRLHFKIKNNWSNSDSLIRLPYDHLSTASLVCPLWKFHLQLPDFLRHRKAAGFTTNVIVMAQSPPQTNTGKATPPADSYRLTLCDTDSEIWSELPALPGMNRGLPMYCGLVGVGSDLVVIGGYDPETWESSNAVFVYNVVSATWRRGSNVPGVRRSLFGCASDSGRMVLVAGGHDDEKNALSSALAYDVGKDEWLPVPDMSMEEFGKKITWPKEASLYNSLGKGLF